MHDDFTEIDRFNSLYRTELKSEINEINGFSGTKVERQTQHGAADSPPNGGILTSQPHFPTTQLPADAVEENKASS